MELKKMIARVMRALPHTPPNVIGEQDIVDLLNEAQLNLARLSSKVSEHIETVAADGDEIPFPDDCLKIVTVYHDGNELSSAIGKLPGEDEGSGLPVKYYTIGNKLIIRDASATEEDYTVAYIPKPADLTEDTDTPDLEGSEEYLVAYALYRLHLEASSPNFQLWDMERSRALAMFMETSDQNYQTPFRVTAQW